MSQGSRPGPPPTGGGFPNAIVGDRNGRPVMISGTVMAYTDANHVAQQVTLTPSGSLNITTDGTVIDALDISGSVRISANNCTVSRCRIQFSGDNVVLIASGTGNTIRDCLVDGLGAFVGSSAISDFDGGNTFIRNNLQNAENGIGALGNNDICNDNYIHALQATGHPDGIQVFSPCNNVTIRHNAVENPNTATSCINLTNNAGAETNMVIDNNLMTSPTGLLQFPMYQRGDGGTTGAVTANWTNNVIQLGSLGYDSIVAGTASPFTFNHSGNTDFVTGANIDGLL